MNMIQLLDYNKFQNALASMVLPTRFVIKNTRKFFGTSLMCLYAGHVFIINAGHTIEDADAGNYEAVVRLPNGNDYSLLSCQTAFICDGKMDIAISDVPRDDARKILDGGGTLFDLAAAYQHDLPKFSRLIFTGYPSSRYNPHANTPRADFISYTVEVARPPYPAEVAGKIDPEYHIAGLATHGKVARINPDGSSTEVDLTGLKGISGGPVFWYDPQNGPRPYFAGIGIENLDSGYIVALKIEAVIAALNSFLSGKSKAD